MTFLSGCPLRNRGITIGLFLTPHSSETTGYKLLSGYDDFAICSNHSSKNKKGNYQVVTLMNRSTGKKNIICLRIFSSNRIDLQHNNNFVTFIILLHLFEPFICKSDFYLAGSRKKNRLQCIKSKTTMTKKFP